MQGVRNRYTRRCDDTQCEIYEANWNTVTMDMQPTLLLCSRNYGHFGCVYGIDEHRSWAVNPVLRYRYPLRR